MTHEEDSESALAETLQQIGPQAVSEIAFPKEIHYFPAWVMIKSNS